MEYMMRMFSRAFMTRPLLLLAAWLPWGITCLRFSLQPHLVSRIFQCLIRPLVSLRLLSPFTLPQALTSPLWGPSNTVSSLRSPLKALFCEFTLHEQPPPFVPLLRLLTFPTYSGSVPVYSSTTKNWFHTQPRFTRPDTSNDNPVSMETIPKSFGLQKISTTVQAKPCAAIPSPQDPWGLTSRREDRYTRGHSRAEERHSPFTGL